MKLFRKIMLTYCILTLFTSLCYSNDTAYFSKILKSVHSAYLTRAAHDPKIAASLSELLIKNDTTKESKKSIYSFIEKAHHYQEEVSAELQAKFPDVIKSSNEKIQINFLDLRLSDAIVVLESVQISPKLSLDIVQKMYDIAVEATSGTHSSAELTHLNVEFQYHLSTIRYAQSVELFDGNKTISGGDLTIKFGDTNSEWKLNIPQIDPKSLGISDLNLLTNANAQNALDSLNTAIHILQMAMLSTSTPFISDAEAMLINMPYMLHQNFNIVIAMRDLAIQAMNGVYNDIDRSFLNMELDYLKLAMKQTQTYLSLFGPITTGAGKITIQIGPGNLPENKLEIDLPATDIKVLGIDKLTLISMKETDKAFSAILKIMKDFVYYPTPSLKPHTSI